LYEKGNVYKVRFVDRIRDNEMNLMQYYAEQQKVLIKRARIEQSLQVFRKYKIGWIAFMKGNKIQSLENKKQVLESSRLICLTYEDVCRSIDAVLKFFEAELKIVNPSNNDKEQTPVNYKRF
jgi:hypothetical protein